MAFPEGHVECDCFWSDSWQIGELEWVSTTLWCLLLHGDDISHTSCDWRQLWHDRLWTYFGILFSLCCVEKHFIMMYLHFSDINTLSSLPLTEPHHQQSNEKRILKTQQPKTTQKLKTQNKMSSTNPGNFANRSHEQVEDIARKGGQSSHNSGFAHMDESKQVSPTWPSGIQNAFSNSGTEGHRLARRSGQRRQL